MTCRSPTPRQPGASLARGGAWTCPAPAAVTGRYFSPRSVPRAIHHGHHYSTVGLSGRLCPAVRPSARQAARPAQGPSGPSGAGPVAAAAVAQAVAQGETRSGAGRPPTPIGQGVALPSMHCTHWADLSNAGWAMAGPFSVRALAESGNRSVCTEKSAPSATRVARTARTPRPSGKAAQVDAGGPGTRPFPGHSTRLPCREKGSGTCIFRCES